MKRILLLLETSKDCDQMDLFTECKKILMSELTTENACEVFQVANKLQIGVKFHITAIYKSYYL